MIGIYEIYNKVNGKRYIGQSLDILDRMAHHKSELRNQRHVNDYLQNAWNLYGEDSFIFSIIEECQESELNEREIYWIDYYNTYVKCENSKGYNLTSGGEGTKLIHPVLQFDLQGNFIKEWDNGLDASRKTGINGGCIYACCIGKIKRGDQYIWLYKEDYEKDNNIIKLRVENQTMQRVLQYDLNCNLVKIWKNAADAENELGISIRNCLGHRTKTANGYIFKHEFDPLIINKEYCEKIKKSFESIEQKSILQIDINGNIIHEYKGIRDAQKDGWSPRSIRECCRNQRNSYKKYIWIYKDKYSGLSKEECYRLINSKELPKQYSILQFDLSHNLIKEYDYLSQVKRDGFCDTNVRDCCMGFLKTYKGYIWEFGKQKESRFHKIIQFDNNGRILGIFNSMTEAEKETGIDRHIISKICKHKTEKQYDYIFKYEEEVG